MKTKIYLINNYGFKWYKDENVHVKGYIFDKHDVFRKGKRLTRYFKSVTNEAEFRKKLTEADGIFSVLIENKERIFASVDRTRTFPLFFLERNRNTVFSDDTYVLREKFRPSLNELSINEFLCTGYVTGRETLLEDIYQLRAGEYLVFEKKEGLVRHENYFNYTSDETSNKSYEKLEEEFLAILEKTARKLVKTLDGKTAVIPLSSGYDSRLIACLLKRQGYKNVICFTYGKKGSFEVPISKKVADSLGFKWYFVEYTSQLINGYPLKKHFDEYVRYISNHSSIMHLQDYLAVEHFKNNNLIPDDSVFVPGHLGGFVAGNAVNELLRRKSLSMAVSGIVRKHYILCDWCEIGIFKEKIASLLPDGPTYLKFEDWDLKERKSKFIINSMRTYEFFGYEHRIPIGDLELLNFFKKLPFNYKLNCKFYEDVILRRIFAEYGVDFKKKKKIFKNKHYTISLKAFLKKFRLLKKLHDFFYRHRYMDINEYRLIVMELFRSTHIKWQFPIDFGRKNGLYNNYALAVWYLSKVFREYSEN